ncbi:hypothetical protein A2737_00455 [Candidatus Nomurabacteria bacterium RIFCSPHIGHO2_01_FULL_41_71]|nr:MAG: hypothetical protein A2737_00455 [Candidatus Nomurabacteria bacterium RIFCSPHIGHO2_01_FULL_41_71]OGI89508.1 MAG: hypothetical protein A3B01_02375 [Candidatus Nomurabacteria bacterium RIFCSPLOWO2_01_FULL_41_52b]
MESSLSLFVFKPRALNFSRTSRKVKFPVEYASNVLRISGAKSGLGIIPPPFTFTYPIGDI